MIWASALGGVYRTGVRLHRRLRKPRRLARPVLSVGGLSSGGAGKTPAAAWLAGALARAGCAPVLLSRGYGRRGSGVELVQPQASDAARRYGDEPVWLARRTRLPVVVGADRWEAGRWALGHLEPGLFVLDDGFQHWGLARDFDLVLLDASADPSRIELLPCGSYREGLEALRRASAVVLTRCNQASEARRAQWRERCAPHVPPARLFEAQVVPARLGPLGGLPGELAGWRGVPVALCSGIGAPDSFERSAADAGLRVLDHLPLRDHGRLQPDRLERLAARWRARGAEALVVTEKDAVKLEPAPELELPVLVLGVELVLDRPRDLLLLASACY